MESNAAEIWAHQAAFEQLRALHSSMRFSQQPSDRQVDSASQWPMQLPDPLQPAETSHGAVFSASQLETWLKNAKQLADQAKAHQRLFDQTYNRKADAAAMLEQLSEQMQKIKVEIHNAEIDCQGLFKIKVEKETGAQQARTEASKLIWAKVEVLHRALASSRGSLVAGEIIKVLTEYLRYQNATALAELMKIIPETSDGFFIFLESKPILARNVKATLRCMQNPAIVAAKANVPIDTSSSQIQAMRPQAKEKPIDQDSATKAGVYVHPNSAHRSVELTGPLIGTRSLPQNFQFTDDPERRSYVGALPPISGFTERPLEPLQKASGSKNESGLPQGLGASKPDGKPGIKQLSGDQSKQHNSDEVPPEGTDKHPSGPTVAADSQKSRSHKHRKPVRQNDAADSKHRKEKRREGSDEHHFERDTIKEKWARTADKDKPKAGPDQESAPEAVPAEGSQNSEEKAGKKASKPKRKKAVGDSETLTPAAEERQERTWSERSTEEPPPGYKPYPSRPPATSGDIAPPKSEAPSNGVEETPSNPIPKPATRAPAKDFRLEEGYQLETVTSFGKRQFAAEQSSGRSPNTQFKPEGTLHAAGKAVNGAATAAQQASSAPPIAAEAEMIKQREKPATRPPVRDVRLDEYSHHPEIVADHRRPVYTSEPGSASQPPPQLQKGDMGAGQRVPTPMKAPRPSRMPHAGLDQAIYEKEMPPMQHSLHPNLAMGYHGMPSMQQGGQIMLLPQQTAMMHQQHLQSLDFRHAHPNTRPHLGATWQPYSGLQVHTFDMQQGGPMQPGYGRRPENLMMAHAPIQSQYPEPRYSMGSSVMYTENRDAIERGRRHSSDNFPGRSDRLRPSGPYSYPTQAWRPPPDSRFSRHDESQLVSAESQHREIMASLEEGAPPHSAHTQASSSQPGSSLSNDPPPLSALAMLEAGENLKMRPLFSNSPKQDLIIDWADEESESSLIRSGSGITAKGKSSASLAITTPSPDAPPVQNSVATTAPSFKNASPAFNKGSSASQEESAGAHFEIQATAEDKHDQTAKEEPSDTVASLGNLEAPAGESTEVAAALPLKESKNTLESAEDKAQGSDSLAENGVIKQAEEHCKNASEHLQSSPQPLLDPAAESAAEGQGGITKQPAGEHSKSAHDILDQPVAELASEPKDSALGRNLEENPEATVSILEEQKIMAIKPDASRGAHYGELPLEVMVKENLPVNIIDAKEISHANEQLPTSPMAVMKQKSGSNQNLATDGKAEDCHATDECSITNGLSNDSEPEFMESQGSTFNDVRSDVDLRSSATQSGGSFASDPANDNPHAI